MDVLSHADSVNVSRMPNGIGVEPSRAQAWRAMRFQALDSVTHAVLGERCDRRGERERRLNTYTDAQRSCPKLMKTGRFMFFTRTRCGRAFKGIFPLTPRRRKQSRNAAQSSERFLGKCESRTFCATRSSSRRGGEPILRVPPSAVSAFWINLFKVIDSVLLPKGIVT